MIYCSACGRESLQSVVITSGNETGFQGCPGCGSKRINSFQEVLATLQKQENEIQPLRNRIQTLEGENRELKRDLDLINKSRDQVKLSSKARGEESFCPLHGIFLSKGNACWSCVDEVINAIKGGSNVAEVH